MIIEKLYRGGRLVFPVSSKPVFSKLLLSTLMRVPLY